MNNGNDENPFEAIVDLTDKVVGVPRDQVENVTVQGDGKGNADISLPSYDVQVVADETGEAAHVIVHPKNRSKSTVGSTEVYRRRFDDIFRTHTN